MKLTNSLTIRFFLPFQPKRSLRFSWIILVISAFCASVSAAEDVQQTEIQNSRQTVKQAEKLARKGNFTEAENVLRRFLAQNTADIPAQLSLSNILLKQRKLVDSYKISFEVAKNNKNPRALALVGMALLNFGNFKDAALLLHNAGMLNEREPLVWEGLGLIDFYENRIDEGVKKLETAAYIEPNEPDFTFTLAQVYARAEKYTLAAQAYDRFLQISPSSDTDRRARIKGLIGFLRYIGAKQKLYEIAKDAPQTVIPIRLARDRPIIEVGMNGSDEKFRFVLDTGSGISVISEETAQRLKMKPISRGGMARAVGGDGKFEIVYGFLRSINLGQVKVNNVPVYIRRFHDSGEKIDGYIGLSLISKFLTTVDYPNLTFTLTKKNQETVANFNKDSVALPLRLTSSGFLSGEVHLHGVEMAQNFIVDTGASISVISQGLANSNELSRFLTEEKMRVVGAAGVTENVRSFLLPKMSFGAHSRESIKAIALDLNVINEASGFEQAGILGGNFLKNYSLTFDFQNSKVTFVPVKK